MGLVPQVDRVDVRDEATRDLGVHVVEQRLVGHGRTQIGAADPDVDHRPDPSTGVTRPLPVADPIGEVAHAPQDLVHVGHHILAIDHKVGSRRHAQRDMQDGAVLGGVDVAPGEHLVAVLFQPRPPGHVDQPSHGVLGGPVLRIVEIEVSGLDRHLGGPIRVLREQLPQVNVLDRFEVIGERAPLLGSGDVHYVSHLRLLVRGPVSLHRTAAPMTSRRLQVLRKRAPGSPGSAPASTCAGEPWWLRRRRR